jgi:hypothetical protein
LSERPQFRWFTADQLIGAAGGDPWEVAEQLHAGDAGAINDLAEAFHTSGSHVKDADDQFNKAKEQFKGAYDRNNGSEHPINDAAEVRRMSTVLAGHPEELTKIAVDLEQTAAALATAQRDSAADIKELNSALQSIDEEITSYGPQIPVVLGQLIDEAEAQTAMSLGILQNIQGAYIDQLHSAETALLASGYVPDALDDADAIPGNSVTEAADQYKNSGQLDKDRATVAKAQAEHPSGPGMLGWELDEIEAKRRLDDYATVTDPSNQQASPVWYKSDQEKDEARFLAGERLDDFNVATSTGPVAKDPILGGDMRDRAKARLYMQRALQDGQLPNHPGLMSADEATETMNSLELQDRATALTRLQEQLQTCGISADAAARVVDGIAHGVVPQQYIEAASAASKALDGGKDGVKAFGEALPTGRHWGPGVAFSEADVESFIKLGKRIGYAGSAVDLGVGLYEWLEEGKSPVEIVTKSVGGVAGAWAVGEPSAMAGGALFGPPGAFVLGLAGATAGAFGGEYAVEQVYQYLKGE